MPLAVMHVAVAPEMERLLLLEPDATVDHASSRAHLQIACGMLIFVGVGGESAVRACVDTVCFSRGCTQRSPRSSALRGTPVICGHSRARRFANIPQRPIPRARLPTSPIDGHLGDGPARDGGWFVCRNMSLADNTRRMTRRDTHAASLRYTHATRHTNTPHIGLGTNAAEMRMGMPLLPHTQSSSSLKNVHSRPELT